MYKLTVEFNSANDLAEFVAAMPGVTMHGILPESPIIIDEDKKPKQTKKPEPKKYGVVKLQNEDGSPLTLEAEIEDARVALRAKSKLVNAKGACMEPNTYMEKNRKALASFDSARSITVLDPKFYVAYSAELDKLLNE